jgi:hypothetical protein
MGHDATPVGGRRRKETLRGPEASEVGADGRGDAAQRGHNKADAVKPCGSGEVLGSGVVVNGRYAIRFFVC